MLRHSIQNTYYFSYGVYSDVLDVLISHTISYLHTTSTSYHINLNLTHSIIHFIHSDHLFDTIQSVVQYIQLSIYSIYLYVKMLHNSTTNIFKKKTPITSQNSTPHISSEVDHFMTKLRHTSIIGELDDGSVHPTVLYCMI